MENITRAAVGRHARLGDLYDASRDRFIPENNSRNALKNDGTCNSDFCILKNAFKEVCDEDSIIKLEMKKETLGIIATNSLFELFKNLDICEQLTLSIISGLETANGSAEYFFSSQLHRTKSAHMTLIYTVCTMHQEVDGILKKLDKDCFDSVEATHLVKGINWGGICSITCHYQNSQNEDDKTVKGKLHSALEKFKESLNHGGDASREMLQGDTEVTSEFTYYVSSDIIDLEHGLQMTFEDALTVAKSLPSTVAKKNGGKGVPLTYELLSLNDLRKNCKLAKSEGPRSKKIGADTLWKCFKAMQEVWEFQQQINDAIEAFNENKEFVPKCGFDAVTNLKANFEDHKAIFKHELAKSVVEARSNFMTVKSDCIKNLLLSHSERFYGKREVIDNIHSCWRIREKLRLIKMFKDRGVLCFGKGELKKDVLQQYQGKHVFLFFMDHRKKFTKPEKWEKQKGLFSKLMVAHGNDDDARLIIFDCELHPGKSMCIQYYKEGLLFAKDLLKEMRHDIGECLVEMAIAGGLENMPNRRLPLTICCPFSLKNACAKKEHQWICRQCREVVNYGKDDGYLYCKCGKADAFYSRFRCNNIKHGIEFIQFWPPESMQQVLSSFAQEIQETNILIFGATGVGKSTWINAIANYYAFPSLQAAVKAKDMEVHIPSQFLYTSQMGGTVKTISVGSRNGNEIQEIGHSATQQSRAYCITIEKHLITLIDTPGIGDVRGMEYDEYNIESILAYLSFYDDIHGICVLLKPNESRLTASFKYCITELLTHLHKSAAKNVAFCFTHARSTFYKPGDTLPILKALLKELKGVKISLTQDNQYYFDNEAFRHLACCKEGIQFEPEEIDVYKSSWERAVTETKRLFKNIQRQKPHSVQETATLNTARRIIIELSKPLAEVAAVIQENIAAAEAKAMELKQSKQTAEELQTQLYLNIIKLKMKVLDQPRTVCTHVTCVEYVKTGGKIQIIYKNHCHENCTLPFVREETTNSFFVLFCKMMHFGTCKICRHSWKDHMRITYELIKVSDKELDVTTEQKLHNYESHSMKLKSFVKEINTYIKEMREEEAEITKISAQFACYLKQNAMTPFNDAVDSHLNMLIKLEKEKPSQNPSTLQNLENMKEKYVLQKKLITRAMEGAGPSCSQISNPGEIERLKEELFCLKHSGPALRSIFSKIRSRNEDITASQHMLVTQITNRQHSK